MNKILTLHYRPPFKNGRSNSFGQYYIHEEFSKHFEVKGIAFGEKDESLPNFKIIPLRISKLKKIFSFILFLKSPRLTHFKSEKFRYEFIKSIEEFKPDFIYVESILMMQYIFNLKTNAKILLYDDDSFIYSKNNFQKNSIYQKLRNTGLYKYEIKAVKKADVTFVITEEEKSELNKIGYDSIVTLPYTIDFDFFKYSWRKPKLDSILFVGNFDHYPNREAVRILINDIIPKVNHGVTLKIVGRNIYRIKKYLNSEISVHENVYDIREFYQNSTLFVAPIFHGAGLRIKILESAAIGIPIILSPIANLGINLIDGKECFLANDTEQFSEKINKFFVMKDEDLTNMSTKANAVINKNFSKTKLFDDLSNTLTNI